MTRRGWFLPETLDVLGLLRAQVAVTIEGVDAFVARARGDSAAAAVVRDAEHRGDTAKRALLVTLRAAFVTPLEPEDVFSLSRSVDWILDYARDLITESEVIADVDIFARAAFEHELLRPARRPREGRGRPLPTRCRIDPGSRPRADVDSRLAWP